MSKDLEKQDEKTKNKETSLSESMTLQDNKKILGNSKKN